MTPSQLIQATGAFMSYFESLNLPTSTLQALLALAEDNAESEMVGTGPLEELVAWLNSFLWPNNGGGMSAGQKVAVLQAMVSLYGIAAGVQ